MDTSRRNLLLGAGGLLAVGTVAPIGAATAWVASGPGSDGADQAAARRRLDELERVGLANWRTTGAWSLGTIFEHLAQGVEYSLTGYPEAKPALVQATIGALAWGAFHRRGELRHDKADPIPGAPTTSDPDPSAALRRLRRAMDAFDAHDGPFAPHFMYGALDRRSYEAAHTLHLADHLREVVR